MNNEPITDKQRSPKYDPHIVPAETGARKDREGSEFMHTPSEQDDLNQEINDQKADAEPLETTGGYTVDKEGLLNNYAIEPEMYVNEPGDLRDKEEALAAERAEELQDANEDKEGQLTMEEDSRGRGPGLI
jgi:hypothetical protein